MSAHSRWPLTTGVAQDRYYCIGKDNPPNFVFSEKIGFSREKTSDLREKKLDFREKNWIFGGKKSFF